MVSANNRHWGEDSLYHTGNAYWPSFRAGRIEKLIKQTPKHDLESLRKAQCDVFNNEAFYLLPLLLKTIKSTSVKKEVGEIVQYFEKWDFLNDGKCLVCGVYRLWVDLLRKKLQLKGSLKEVILYNLLLQEEEKAIKEIYPQLVLALEKLNIKSSKDLKPWGEIHFSFFHSLAGKKRFSAPRFPLIGGKHTVNVAKAVWRGDYFESRFGASHRLVVELSSPPKAWSVLAGPQRDYYPRNPNDEQGPWMKWKKCMLQRNLFPLDWKKVETTSLSIP